jgi:IclR family pca regulon transcriptional regulator
VLTCGVRTLAGRGSTQSDEHQEAASDAGDMAERPQEFIQSLARGLAVIRAFSSEKPQLTLSEVAEATNLSRAAARRFLLTLQALGYVGSTGRLFYLRPPVLDLGYAYLSSFSVADIAQSHLQVLSATLNESCSSSVLDGGDIVHIARATTTRIMTIQISVGRRLPAYATAMGRVLLASLAPDELDHYFATYARPYRNSKTETHEPQLRRILDDVRRQGWTIIDQELEDGVRSVAAPIHDATGAVVAAINASAHTSRASVHQLKTRFLPALLETARAIDKDLNAHR